MNHDMIAAGHPRLDFELSAFLANMPPHWDVKAQAKRDGEGYEARVWAVGQIATTRATLDLLADRARNANRPWPEFSEYNCYACHHDLTDPSWRQNAGHYAGRQAGSLPWGTWYSVMPLWIAERPPFGGAANDKTIAQGFDALEKAMAAPLKNRSNVPAQAKELAKRLAPLLAKTSQTKLSQNEIETLLSSLAETKPTDPAPDWDAAEQLYLAAAALSQDRGAERSQEKLGGLVRMLAQPRAYRPEEFLKDFQPALKNLVEK